MPGTPPLTVVLPTRDGLREVEPALRGLESQAQRAGAEVLVVGAVNEPAPPWLRVIHVEDDDIYNLRMVGLREASGEIVAVGEDHAVPREDWCEAVLRAHAEHPDAPAIAGCLVNATAETLSGRANFLAFAAPFQPPMPVVPPLRPPPVSAVSVKRWALTDLSNAPGDLEALILPRLFEEGLIAADERILVDHYQDHGMIWAILNSFHSARASYGRLQQSLRPFERLQVARWSLSNWPRRIMREARARTTDPRELGAVAMIAIGCSLGAVVGSLGGPGRSRARVA